MLAKHFVGMLALGVMSAGCAFSAKDDVSETPTTGAEKQGLTIVSADPTHGFVGFYREGKRVVRFETTRTLVTHDDWDLYDSSGVPVSISSRFTDESGSALYTSLGEAAPESWQGSSQPEVHFDTPPTKEWAEERLELFHVAGRAGEALAKLSLTDPRMAPERNELVAVAAQTALEHTDVEELDNKTPPPTVSDEPGGTLSIKDYNNGATYYREKFRIKTNLLHVCTIWKAQYYRSGVWYTYGTYDNKDHGSSICANDGESVKCTVSTGSRSSTSSMRTTRKWCDASSTCNNSSGDTNECKGTYNGGADGLGAYSEYCMVRLGTTPCHNCKRDAWVQKRWVLDRSDTTNTSNCYWDSATDPDCNGLPNVSW